MSKKIKPSKKIPFDLSKLNLEQRIAYEIVKAGVSCFITGGGGVGKSFLIDAIRETIKGIVTLAPTGIAALNIQGSTVNSFFKLPFGNNDLEFASRLKRGDKERLNKAKIILIDEISMNRCDMLDIVDLKLRNATSVNEPFGGKQVVMVGDFNQLEPIFRRGTEEHAMLRDEYDDNYYAFNSNVWRELEPLSVVLTEPVRQHELPFIRALRNIRLGHKVEESLKVINSRLDAVPEDDDLRIVTKNAQCDQWNDHRFELLEGEETVYKAKVVGKFKDRPVPEDIYLKVGARVMISANSKPDDMEEYVNGDLGNVVKLNKHSVVVKLDRGPTVSIGKYIWEAYTYEPNKAGDDLERVINGSYEAIPLKLSYALSSHKSQGATVERCVIDFSEGVFACGQAYVSLSRVKTLSGLFLQTKILPYHIKVNPYATEYTLKASKEALARREEDIKKYGLEGYEQTKEVKVVEYGEDSFLKSTLSTLSQIIDNQLHKGVSEAAFLQTLENFEMAGITTEVIIKENVVDDMNFCYKSRLYSGSAAVGSSIKDWLKDNKVFSNKKVKKKELVDYIDFLSDRIKELAPKDETKDKTAEVIKKPVAVKYSSAIVQLAKNIKGISDDEMHKKLSNLNHSEMTVLQKLIR